MRTTIVLDDQLARDAKRAAASRGITLSRLVGEALRAALMEATGPVPKFEMVTWDAGPPETEHEPADFEAALDQDDRSSLGE